jgi:membrane fusion protein (multidrug efflux system)
MKRAVILIVVVVVVAAVVYFVRVSSIERDRREREEMVNNSGSEVVVPVLTAPVIEGEVESILKYTGIVEPAEQVDVYPKVAGRIVSVKVDEGDEVRKDEVLAVIDPEITGQKFEPFEVTSPMAGKVAHKFVDPGAYVTQMQPVVMVMNDRSVKVAVGILEKDYHEVSEGADVRIEFDALPGKVREARITNRSPVVDARTGTAKVEIRLANTDGMLKAGMFARVRVIAELRRDVTLMPLGATLTEVLPGRGVRAEANIFVVEGDVARERGVVLGLSGPTHYEVLDGLTPGERVVVMGQNLLRDGTKIRILESGS